MKTITKGGPQIRYCPKRNLNFNIPTDKLEKEQQVFIELKLKDGIDQPDKCIHTDALTHACDA